MTSFEMAYIEHPDGETTEFEQLTLDDAIGLARRHDWRAELSAYYKRPGSQRSEPGLRLFLPSYCFLWIEPQLDGTFRIAYGFPKEAPSPDAEWVSAHVRRRDELPPRVIDEIVRRFAAEDHAWMVAITASRSRCVAAFVSLITLGAGFIFGGSWLLAWAIEFDAARNLGAMELVGWMIWMCAMITVAFAIWIALARRFLTRAEALAAWLWNGRIDRWIFNRFFPELLDLGSDPPGK